MIRRTSTQIAGWLIKAEAIPEEDRGLYEYAAYSLLFSLIPLALVMFLGTFSGMLLEGVLMILPFMLIRKFSGGFHLKSPGICLVTSTLLLSAFLLIIRAVADGHGTILFVFLVVASALQIFLCSPIDNDARKLDEKERLVFKKIARGMSVIFLVLYIALLLGHSHFSVPIGAGILLTALLQIPCFFAGKHHFAR